MRKRKLANIIIITLSSMLIISSAKFYKAYNQIRNKTTKELTITENIKLIDADLLIKKLNKVNKMVILNGETSIKATYSNKDIQSDDVSFKWVKGFIEALSSKELYVDAIYSFSYVYNLDDLQIEIVDNIPQIHISKNRLSVSVGLNENQTIYTDKVGFFESEFTPQELNSLNARTKDLVYNKLVSSEEYRKEAFSSLKENIDKLLGYECKYIENEYDVLESQNEISFR